MRWFLISVLSIVLVVDIVDAVRISQYEVSATKPNNEKDRQQTALKGPFVLVAQSAVISFLDFADRNDKAITALSTLVIAIFTVTLWNATAGLLNHGREVERAYVKLSHANDLRLQGNGHLAVRMEIKNWGRTPAQITDMVIGCDIRTSRVPLPEHPPYPGRVGKNVVHAFLVAGEGFFVTNPIKRVFTDEERLSIERGTQVLTLMGYVEYRDKFDRTHRAGYARTYLPHRPGDLMNVLPADNLVFVTQENYNYDRQYNA